MTRNGLMMLLIVSMLGSTSVFAVEAKKAPYDKFYGKITKVDVDKRTVSVYNKRRDQDSQFVWDGETAFVSSRKPIPASDLKVGQSLIVSYVAEGQENKAKKITVRAMPTRKKAAREAVQ